MNGARFGELRWRVLWVLLGGILLSSLLPACSPMDRDNPLEDLRRDLTESDEGVVRALVDKFDRWLTLDEFELPLTLVRIIRGIVGFLLLFAGYALYKLLVMLIGVIVGAIMGYGFGVEEGGRLLGILLLLVGGWLGGVLAWFLHMLVVFAIGAFCGAILLAALIDGETWVLIVGGLLGGILLLALFQLLIVLTTASTGAVLFGGLALGASDAVILILFVLGVLVQYGLLASREQEEERGEKAKSAPAD